MLLSARRFVRPEKKSGKSEGLVGLLSVFGVGFLWVSSLESIRLRGKWDVKSGLEFVVIVA